MAETSSESQGVVILDGFDALVVRVSASEVEITPNRQQTTYAQLAQSLNLSEIELRVLRSIVTSACGSKGSRNIQNEIQALLLATPISSGSPAVDPEKQRKAQERDLKKTVFGKRGSRWS